MKLIGAGLPRTATLTQKVVLEMLGLGPCYHMVNVLGDLDQVRLWRDALAGRPDWHQIFDGFESTVDWPGGFFYRELLEIYPDAKVLLSVRDPDAWERSMRDTVWSVYYGGSLMCHLSHATTRVDDPWNAYIELMKLLLWDERGTLRDGRDTREGMIAAMERHNEEVKRTVPPERLLVWDASEGWEPLCAFLGVDVPDAPVPRLNDSREFKDRVIDMAITKINAWHERERAEMPVPSAP